MISASNATQQKRFYPQYARTGVIRAAENRDLPRIVEMGERFHAATAFRNVGFEPETFRAAAFRLMESPEAALLVAGETPQGMIGGIMYPLYFNARHWAAQELFWWVEPEHRGIGGVLLRAFEQWARESGAASVHMIAIENLKPVDRLYLRSGYEPAERHYMRVI